MVALSGQLFYTTQIPVCLWFLAKNKTNSGKRDRRGEVLFIDARNLGTMVSRVQRTLTPDDHGKAGSEAVDTAIAQLVSEAVTGDQIIDIYPEAGIEKPELSILSDEFLDKLAASERPNLQMELLRRLLADQIRTLRRSNVVQSRRFSELLDAAINRYQNRALTTAEIIAELVALAKEMRDTKTREDELGLSDAEVAVLPPVDVDAHPQSFKNHCEPSDHRCIGEAVGQEDVVGLG